MRGRFVNALTVRCDSLFPFYLVPYTLESLPKTYTRFELTKLSLELRIKNYGLAAQLGRSSLQIRDYSSYLIGRTRAERNWRENRRTCTVFNPFLKFCSGAQEIPRLLSYFCVVGAKLINGDADVITIDANQSDFQ